MRFRFRQTFQAILDLVVISASHAAAQSPESLSQFFQGKQVTVKLDMPASQKGVDIYPDRSQPLDTKNYSND